MTAFSQIQTDVANWVLDLPTETEASIPAFINKAMHDIESEHNFKHMEATLELTTTVFTRELGSKPALWKERRGDPWLLDNDNRTREFFWAPSESEMIRRYNNDNDDDGEPYFLLEHETTLDVYPLPDGDSDYIDGEYRVNIPYYARTAELSADEDTNWFTENMRWYLVYQGAAEASKMNRDLANAQLMQTMADGERKRGINLDKRSRLSKRLSLAPRRDQFGPARGYRR